VYALNFDPDVCESCETCDCLMKCQYLAFDLEAAKIEKARINRGEDSRVLTDCATCYACEEYCPNGNHPFYLIVERQEQKGILPAPGPITRQQVLMMKPRGTITPMKVKAPVIDMCYFPTLVGSIRAPLYENPSIIVGSDVFCNIMWLHFARNSVIRDQLPKIIDNIWHFYLKDSGVDELVCFHDECYATFTHLAPAFNIPVPFKAIHVFEYISGRLEVLKDSIKPINARVAYQRPCSNRLIPETQHWVDDIFEKIGAERVERAYDRENALCCGQVLRAHQREEMADDVQTRNLKDMRATGATYCVFNCPACMATLAEAAAEMGMFPIHLSDLCQHVLVGNASKG
jgi:Fe-S oxidoreductase